MYGSMVERKPQNERHYTLTQKSQKSGVGSIDFRRGNQIDIFMLTDCKDI